MRRLAFIALVAVAACAEVKKQARLGLGGSGASGHPGQQQQARAATPTDVATAVGAAVGMAAASRAMGGCVASCPPGTACNEKTGLCEVMPCRNLCRADEVCENERCVPVLLPNLKIKRQEGP